MKAKEARFDSRKSVPVITCLQGDTFTLDFYLFVIFMLAGSGLIVFSVI